MSDTETKKWRFGFKRWIVLGLIVLGGLAAYGPITYLHVVSPVVVLPGEPTGLTLFGMEITNTIMATLLADVVIFFLALSAWRFSRSGKDIPSGLYNAFEAIVEFLWNSVTGAVGSKRGLGVMSVTGTIFILVFVANMVKLVPGFESIGYMIETHGDHGYAKVELFSIAGVPVYTIDGTQKVEVDHETESLHPESEAAAEANAHPEEIDAHAAKAAGADCHACEVVPYLRGSATDLNFTFALAFVAVFMTQVFGVMALGPGYFEKFFQFRQLFSGGVFGLITFAVGLLEIVLELAKILSFGFRLFGNIFAGALLLSIIGALLPIILPPGLYLFEIFFGMIQAYVFFLLATMFVSMAVVSHHGDDHAEAHH